MINLQRILIVGLIAALILVMLDNVRVNVTLDKKNAVIYGLTQDLNGMKNQNILLKQALMGE